jgi:hypothetical protein
MPVLTIPAFEDPFYSMSVALEGRQYIFEFRYNQRETAWYFSVALENGTPLIAGVKVVCGVNLLKRAADVRLPPGLLSAVWNGDDDSPPTLTELGEDKRVTLTYITSDEL